MSSSSVSARFDALGTTTVVAVTSPRRLAAAVAEVEAEIAEIDRTYSRFRPDSELMQLQEAPDSPATVSPLLAEALSVAFRAAEATGGLVDPTVGTAVSAIGYDRDYAQLVPLDRPLPDERRVPGISTVGFDKARREVRVRRGTNLDLGATGKALAVDRAVARAAKVVGCGVLVSIGGDLGTAGPAPAGGWSIGIADDHRADLDQIEQAIAITRGAIATSSTTTRTWERAGERCHHIVDPRRGRSAEVVWRTVTVAAGTCVAANVASTAAIVDGRGALARLTRAGLPSRLVTATGDVTSVGGWPNAGESE